MEDILDPPLKRQLFLYQLLIQKGRLRITDITNLTKLDARTISKDLNAIAERSKDILFTIGTDHITLETTKIASLDFYEKTLLESSAIRLLLTILDCKAYTITSLSTVLFISESTLKRQITKLNKFFRQKSMDITVKTTPNIYITGNETLIRAFYQHLLLEVYSELVKSNKKFASLLPYLESFLQYNVPQYTKFTTLEHIGVYLYIAVLRSRHTFTEKNTEINRFQMYILNAIERDTVFQHFLLREFNFVMCPSTVQSIIITDLTSVLWNEEQVSFDVLDRNKVNTFVVTLFEKLNVSFKLEQNVEALNLLYLHTIYQQPITHFINSSYELFVTKLKAYNPNLLSEIINCLQLTNLANYLRSDDVLYEFIYYTCLLFPDLSVRTTRKIPISIGVCSLRGKVAQLQAEKFLKQYLGNRISITVLSVTQLNKEACIQNLDLLITDIPVRTQGLPILELPLILDKHFLEHLETTINQLK